MGLTRQRSTFWLSLTTGLLLGSCVTINIYFPAAAVEKAADRIIKETWGSGTEDEEAPREQGPQGRLLRGGGRLVVHIGTAPAAAQDVDINVSTPAIRALKDSMHLRSASLKPYLDRGAVGISNAGLLVVRDPGALSLQEKAAVTRGVAAENGDREALYREIAAANKFDANRVQDIKNIFAVSWIRNAAPGWWVQDAQGGWSKHP